MYKEKNREKSETYANEAESVVNSSDYPYIEEANHMKTYVKRVLK